jgi:hypothetical protein
VLDSLPLLPPDRNTRLQDECGALRELVHFLEKESGRDTYVTRELEPLAVDTRAWIGTGLMIVRRLGGEEERSMPVPHLGRAFWRCLG